MNRSAYTYSKRNSLSTTLVKRRYPGRAEERARLADLDPGLFQFNISAYEKFQLSSHKRWHFRKGARVHIYVHDDEIIGLFRRQEDVLLYRKRGRKSL